MIKVLIVEGSRVMQQVLKHAISVDPMLTVVGVASDGEEALEAVKELHPDVIAMGWQMPKLDGLKATRTIMETTPTPIVIVTGSVAANDAAVSFRMIEAGALAILQQPPDVADPGYQTATQQLTRTLKLMSEVKLVKRVARTSPAQVKAKLSVDKMCRAESDIQLVAIGASTGGPNVLQQILFGLPKDLPVPLFIVQHISKGFTAGLVEWLQNTTAFPLHVASHGESPLPGHGYVAPDDLHMGVERGPVIVLNQGGLENGLRPSVAYLFRSVAQHFGSHAVGVLLTGMGRDGADELKMMKEQGANTIAQDEKSSIIHGMPGEAIRLNAATYVLSPEDITLALTALIKNNESVAA
ncbi:MAG: chemotaxis-specific protein-glutamate methyltransferase CheB [Bacteroidota bacterium]